MLKRMVTYKDFDDQEQTELLFFNLTGAEMMKVSVSHGGNIKEYIDSIVQANDAEKILALVEELILLSYGVKSEDGKRFVKSDQLREDFACSAAYSAIFTELAFDGEKQMAFVEGIMPPDWQELTARAEREAAKRNLPT